MRTIVRLAALAVLGPAAASGLALAATASSASASSASVRTSVFEAQVVSQTNAARVRAGCEKLRVSRSLAKAAESHSREMARRDFFSHTGADGSRFTQRTKEAGFTSQPMGENIAWGYKNAEGVTRGWLRSPGHRRNMLNCRSTLIGVGAVRNSDGVLYWTQEFGK
ncbi:CAP domain-containing protein [Catenuloplanes japonicus]|uniref:CAP domain-containing protein n=1 Tax=Catenuloplanes japonicus TaxID=33876 RepID=UPI00052558C8|nr:CAP domain-containing protein [Catenuloplanes japonicus]